MGRFGSKFAIMMALGGAFLLATASPAKAVPLFFVVFKDLTDGAEVAVFDGGPGDTSPLVIGKITTFDTAVGGFLVSTSTEISNSPGVAAGATLTMGVTNVSRTDGLAAILEVTTTSTDYTLPPPPLTIQDSQTMNVAAEGTAGVTMTGQSWVSDSNLPGVSPIAPFPDDPAALENPTTLMSMTVPKGKSDSRNNAPESTDIAAGVPKFSITNRGTFTFEAGAIIGSAGITTEVNGVGVIPGPGGLALVLGGLPFLGVSWLRRRGKQA